MVRVGWQNRWGSALLDVCCGNETEKSRPMLSSVSICSREHVHVPLTIDQKPVGLISSLFVRLSQIITFYGADRTHVLVPLLVQVLYQPLRSTCTVREFLYKYKYMILSKNITSRVKHRAKGSGTWKQPSSSSHPACISFCCCTGNWEVPGTVPSFHNSEPIGYCTV